jgi:hypothetical protein
MEREELLSVALKDEPVQLVHSETVDEEENDFLAGTQVGGGQSAEHPVRGTSAAGADEGGHEVDQVAAVVIGTGQVGKAERMGHGRSVTGEGGRGKGRKRRELPPTRAFLQDTWIQNGGQPLQNILQATIMPDGAIYRQGDQRAKSAEDPDS